MRASPAHLQLLAGLLITFVAAWAQPLSAALPAMTPARLATAATQASSAKTAPLPGRDSARLPGKGRWTVGIFNPLEIGITDKISIETHPLLLIASPNVTVRHSTFKFGGWRLTQEYGLNMPRLGVTSALPLGVAGYFTPDCKVTAHDPSKANSCDQGGWVLVPSLGAKLSTGARHIWTIRAEVAVGLPLSGELWRPLEHIPPADLLFAPITYGFRARLGGRYDRALTDRLRLTGEANIYLVGASAKPYRNPLTVTGHIGIDIAVGSASRFTVGVMYTNSDQRKKDVETVDGRPQRVPVRNHDFYPTIDFIFGG